MALRIHALRVGEMLGYPQPLITLRKGWTEAVDIPLIMFVVVGDGVAPVVVDTGGPSEEVFEATRGGAYGYRRPAEEEPLAQLARLGIRPEDVELVINTHLHWDHSTNNALFPNARIVVQRDELWDADHPLENTRSYYKAVDSLEAPLRDRLELVNGAAEIVPGITVVPLPGHTGGSQGVLVQGRETRYLLAGDTIYSYANWPEHGQPILSGNFTDMAAHERSFALMRSLNCEVIPSHDPRVVDRAVFE